MTYSGSYFAGYVPPGIEPGSVLADRYRVITVLGQGGFGRTYLASDNNRFNEQCVLKEFAPQVQHPDHLQKAQDLFEREAGVLYRLNHSQIPCFRELLRTRHQDRDYLLLVQDFVKGQTYRDLLTARQRQGAAFGEGEIIQLLQQLLPVLAYIHANGVIHRDISPDNLMRRESDGLPILIDFGGVKQAAASVLSEFSQSAPQATESTRLGKAGYAPAEQLQQGLVYPHSDLYALGVTVLVLLTGQEPQTLINPHTLEWQWRSWVQVSQPLAAVLDRLLAYRPSDRFPSATAVLLTLNGAATPGIDSTALPSNQGYVIPPYPLTNATVAIGGVNPATGYPTSESRLPVTPPSTKPQALDTGTIVAFLLFMAIALGGFWGLRGVLFSQEPEPTPSSTPTPINPTPTPTIAAQAWPRDASLLQKATKEGIPANFFQALVDDRFYATYGNQSLTTAEADAKNREIWIGLGQDWLNQLRPLPKEWRSSLGRYQDTDYGTWVNQVQGKGLGKSALVDLVDNTFFRWFPNLSEEEVNNSPPLLQLWFSLAALTTDDIASGKVLQQFSIDPNSYNGRIEDKISPRQGVAYVGTFQAGDTVRANLDVEDGAFQWSIYSPKGEVIRKSTQYNWEGTIAETGAYQFVVLGGDREAQFSLDIIAEPIVKPTPEATPTPDSTDPGKFESIEPSSTEQAEPEDNEDQKNGKDKKKEAQGNPRN
jgi:serine/threonine-protein kinase